MQPAEGRTPIAARLHDVVTARLTLRRLTTDDLRELAVIFAQREVWEFPYGRGMTAVEAEAFLDRQHALWCAHGFGGCAARERDGGRLVGVIGLSVPTVGTEPRSPVSVGWRLAPSAWGRGYATEGAAALVDEAFTTLRYDRICCITQPENVRSVRLAERLGMTFAEAVDVRTDDDASHLTAVIYESRIDDPRRTSA
ncbi:MAG: N-acetyltransferase [Actinomycetia bacterium]|nr:N-acetyltransferase [Actinomycetes bacterium]